MTTTTQNAGDTARIQRLIKIQVSYEALKGIALLAVNAIGSPTMEHLEADERILIAESISSLIRGLEAEF